MNRAAVLVLGVVACACGRGEETSDVPSRRVDALGSPALIRDIDPAIGLPGSASSDPSSFTALGSSTVFFASTPGVGREPWITDGTPAGTRLIRDVAIGSSSVASALTYFTEFNGALYFRGFDPNLGTELFRTDGTLAGTGVVVDACAGSCNGISLDTSGNLPLGPKRVPGGVVWVGAAPGSPSASVLYVSDGTVGGTRGVATLPNSPRTIVSTGARAYFDTGSLFSPSGNELWSSDGTDGGTGMVIDLAPGNGSSNPSLLTPVGSTLYFVGFPSTNVLELWKTDGTPAGTSRVVTIGDAAPYAFVVSGQVGYLLTVPRATGNGLLSQVDLSTGTLSPIGPATFFGATATPVAVSGGRAVYQSSSALLGTDGTDAGTFTLSASLSSLGGANGLAWFGVNNVLWKTDATPAGTVSLGAVGTTGGVTGFAAGAGGLTYFAGTNLDAGNEPWVTNGTTMTFLGDLTPPIAASSNPFGEKVVLGPYVLFTASSATTGQELWRTDGVTAAIVQDLTPGSGSSSPSNLVVAQGKAYFVANGGVYRTDGSDAGIEALPVSGTVRELVGTPIGAFATFNTGAGPTIYAWTGPDAGATTVGVFPNPVAPARPPGLFTEIGGTVYFYGWTPGSSGQIWRTDGTPGNTTTVTSLAGQTQLYNFTNAQNRLYLSNNVGTMLRLECSGSTTQVGTAQGRSFTPSGSGFFFEGTANGIDFMLYRAQNVTSAPVLELNTTGTDAVSELQPWNGGVVFTATDGTTRRVYFSDGTAGGTRALTTLPVAAAPLAVQGGATYVTAQWPDAGVELVELQADGGAALVGDLQPGLGNSNATAAKVLGSRLVFAADVAGVGREPWGVDIVRGAYTDPSFPAACTWPVVDAGIGTVDAGVDAGSVDAGSIDAGSVDAGSVDAGSVDAGSVDAGSVDAGSVDAGSVDAGSVDAGDVDAGSVDAGSVIDGGSGADGGASGDAGSGADPGVDTHAGTDDAGVEPDGGALEDGGSGTDAGASNDAGVTTDAGNNSGTDAGTGDVATGGCGCTTADPAVVWTLALAAFALRRRRG
ncbi:MAG: MYXO-CTERM sorting domain-containing protein [Myxococcaceae bacterium]